MVSDVERDLLARERRKYASRQRLAGHYYVEKECRCRAKSAAEVGGGEARTDTEKVGVASDDDRSPTMKRPGRRT